MGDSKIVDIKPRGHKAPLQLLPLVGLAHTACALEDGMVKYELDNWRGATDDWEAAYVGAGLRHLWEVADRDYDDRAEDTGVHHVAHASACCIIALYHSGADYVHPVDAITVLGESPTPIGCQTSFDTIFPAAILPGWSPRLDLLPYQPLCAIAGALESSALRAVPNYRVLLARTIEKLRGFYEKGDGQDLAYAAAGCMLLLSWPDSLYMSTVRPSLNVVANAYLEAAQPDDEGLSICPVALERMMEVRRRREPRKAEMTARVQLERPAEFTSNR